MEATDISKSYAVGLGHIEALRNVTITIHSGEHIAIMGPSGSGKSTLLNMIGCLDRPTRGSIYLDGDNINKLGDDELSLIRATRIGHVFQTFNLIHYLNIYENVALPFLYSHQLEDEVNQKVMNAIEQVGLTHRLSHKPSELSGGEMQRAAIARALAVSPSIILADEPTGNLDSKNSMMILELFRELNDDG
ncbi:MAG: ABC transporter ATP-binding protein [Mariprofundaceae bacterium]